MTGPGGTAPVDRLLVAVGEAPGRLVGKVEHGHPEQWRERQDVLVQPAIARGRLEALRVDSVGSLQSGGLGPAKGVQVPAAAQLRAEVSGDRPHVRAGAATQVDGDVGDGVVARDFEQLDGVNGHRPRLERERLPRTRCPMRGAAALLPGAERRGHLVEGADEPGQCIGDGQHPTAA